MTSLVVLGGVRQKVREGDQKSALEDDQGQGETERPQQNHKESRKQCTNSQNPRTDSRSDRRS